jgi:selenocysteine lyase/cysteine desulfurase
MPRRHIIAEVMTVEIERIRAAYSRFLQPGRVLLTGHSHQAWPDCARDAQTEMFDDSARWIDDKWERAVLPLLAEVGRGVLGRMGFSPDDAIAFAENTHSLVVRLLSAFDVRSASIVTTTGEFHSLDRQLRRAAEDGLRVVWVDASPRSSLAERIVGAIARERPTLVALSAVLFEDAWVVSELPEILRAADRAEATMLVDAYHAFNALPIAWGEAGQRAFVVAGGYKYAAFGNGLSWLRVPDDCHLRPADTGWFSDFESLAEPRDRARPVRYGAGGSRFAGATFEASAFYRARAVLAHWDALGLSVPALRAISTRQTRRIIDGVRALDGEGGALELVSSDDDARRGAFVALRHPRAVAVASELKQRGVWIDSRADLVRVGPAPYLRDADIDEGVAAIAEVARELR